MGQERCSAAHAVASSFSLQVLKAYLRSALWITGLAVDLLGAVLMLEAVANAPVSETISTYQLSPCTH